MSDVVTIVTAFVDIGRDKWVGSVNGQQLPYFLKRDVDTYFQRFERLSKLKNPIVVFTESKFVDRIQSIRDDITVVDVGNLFDDHKHVLDKIKAIQQSLSFTSFVDRKYAPEYWSPEYVLINFLKSHLVTYAVDEGLCKTETTAWIDFGYVRDDTYCPEGMEWKFDTGGDINLFSNSPYTHDLPIFHYIKNGDVVIQGCHVVAPNEKWHVLKALMNNALSTLFSVGFVDDDQTLLLMSYRAAPEHFKINNGNPADWFIIFKDFNHD